MKRMREGFGLRWFAAAVWVANRWFPYLWKEGREQDCLQTAYMAALEVQNLDEEHRVEVFRSIEKAFSALSKDLGFRGHTGRKEADQLEGELVNGDRGIPATHFSIRPSKLGRMGLEHGTLRVARNPCGACGAENAPHLDSRLARLCHACYSALRQRRNRGMADPYENLGVRRRVVRTTKPACGVPGCDDSGMYSDERYGQLCLRHRNVVAKRRRNGWSDPYKGLDDSEPVEFREFVPETEAALWAKIRLGVNSREWTAMWLWAHGETPNIGEGILAKARAAAGCGRKEAA
jgi:hypothetical protein